MHNAICTNEKSLLYHWVSMSEPHTVFNVQVLSVWFVPVSSGVLCAITATTPCAPIVLPHSIERMQVCATMNE